MEVPFHETNEWKWEYCSAKELNRECWERKNGRTLQWKKYGNKLEGRKEGKDQGGMDW